jgi:hypothetical protein
MRRGSLVRPKPREEREMREREEAMQLNLTELEDSKLVLNELCVNIIHE